jgi:MoaA/NifB/PqqE/SkfB family radical SAM enzyme
MFKESIRKKLPKLLEELEKEPLRVCVEPTNACNALCSFCANKDCKRERKIMNFEQYKKTLAQIMEVGSRELKFTPIIGDPFVDPGFLEKVKYAKSLNYFKVIYTFSNMIGANYEKADEIVNSGLTQLMISTCLQGREDYKRIYGVDRFDQAMKNILTLLEANQKLGNPLDVSIWLRHDKGFDLAKSPYYQKMLRYTSKINVLNDDYDNWSGMVTQEDLPKGQKFKKKKDNTWPCAQFYNGLVVGPSGEVGMCWARDTNFDLKVGNINENSFREIWQGEKVKGLRQQWLAGKIPYPCSDCLQYCSVLDHSLVQKYILRHVWQYPLFLPYVARAKWQALVERATGVWRQWRQAS